MPHRSRPFLLALLVPLALAGCEPPYPQAQPALVRLDPAQRFQTIEGIGGSAANESELRRMAEPARSEVMDLVFGDLEPSVVRVKPRPAIEPANDDADPATKDPAGFVRPDDHLWQLDEITARGAPLLVGALWTPPAWMKTNQQETQGGSLLPGMAPELAEFFSAYLDFVAAAGHRLDALSIQNEPEAAAPWDSNVYDPASYGATLETVAQRLAADGHDVALVAPDNAVLSFTLLYLSFVTSQPTASQRLAAIAFHLYQYGYYDFAQHAAALDALAAAAPPGLPLWMTEYSNTSGIGYGTWEEGLAQAKLVHGALVRGVSTYVMWNLYRPGGPGEALVVIPTQPGQSAYTVTPKYWTLRQFTKWVRPGAVRIGAHSDDPLVLVSAYRDEAAARTVAVLINDADAARWAVVEGGALGAPPRVVRSSAGEQGVELAADARAVFASRAVHLPARSVTTVVWPDPAP
jgi:O-glycosyl hydrolase